MIPIRDEMQTHRTPFVNYGLILINVVVFLLTYVLNPNPEGVYSQFAFFPNEIRQGLDLGDVRSILTSMFMHLGWVHLLGNMLYLWIFGDNIEDKLGHINYLIFYLAGGVFAAFAHYLSNPDVNHSYCGCQRCYRRRFGGLPRVLPTQPGLYFHSDRFFYPPKACSCSYSIEFVVYSPTF